MEARRARRREKKKQRMARQENIPCIVFLATDEESFELAEKKEDRQLRYINQYADAHGLIPMKIVRKSCFAPYVVNQRPFKASVGFGRVMRSKYKILHLSLFMI